MPSRFAIALLVTVTPSMPAFLILLRRTLAPIADEPMPASHANTMFFTCFVVTSPPSDGHRSRARSRACRVRHRRHARRRGHCRTRCAAHPSRRTTCPCSPRSERSRHRTCRLRPARSRLRDARRMTAGRRGTSRSRRVIDRQVDDQQVGDSAGGRLAAAAVTAMMLPGAAGKARPPPSSMFVATPVCATRDQREDRHRLRSARTGSRSRGCHRRTG